MEECHITGVREWVSDGSARARPRSFSLRLLCFGVARFARGSDSTLAPLRARSHLRFGTLNACTSFVETMSQGRSLRCMGFTTSV